MDCSLSLRICGILRKDATRTRCLLLTESHEHTALLLDLSQNPRKLFCGLSPPLPNRLSSLHILFPQLLPLKRHMALS